MSTPAIVSIVTACAGVPLLLAASFYHLTVRLVASGAEERFAVDLRENRTFANRLTGAGAGLCAVAVTTGMATLI